MFDHPDPFDYLGLPADPRTWTDEDICRAFDLNPDLRVQTLARMTGKTGPEVVMILYTKGK